MSEESWYQRGFGGEPMKPQSIGYKEGQPRRVWLKRDTSKELTFLDDAPFVFVEHCFNYKNSWNNYETCIAPMGKICALDDLDNCNCSEVAAFSVIDKSSYKDKNGKEHKNEKRLYVVKKGAWEKLERRVKDLRDKGLSLKGATFKVFRGQDSKAPASGDDFEYQGHVDLSKVKDPEKVAPFDYLEIFKPDEDRIHRIAAYLNGRQRLEGSVDDAPF